MTKVIETDTFELADVSGEAGGYGFEITCPQCGDKILWAPSAWWSKSCTCRFVWEIDIKAVGTKWGA